ncbi:MAG: hypothetical protein JW794_05565 [Candidatus Cloacimonetes bacterium]|nr:hypothetical protein [Candidatus Cloacimonadota bacterium]
MRCIKKNILLDYLSDELSSQKKKHIEKHISVCPHCRLEVEEWKKVLNLTEEFVSQDIKRHPVPPHAHIMQRFERIPQKEKHYFWNWAWVKPAIATAVVLFAALMIFFMPHRATDTTESDYYVIDNVTYSETVSLSDLYLDDLESMYLEEICENEELTNDILYGDWQHYDEILNNLDQEELEKLVNELYKSNVT